METYGIEQSLTQVPIQVVAATRRVRRILVAEDDPDLRRLLASVLRRSGYMVVEAADGTEILDRMESTVWGTRPEAISAIVSDINMPGLTGLDVLAALRCAQWDTPVILISAFGDDDTRKEAAWLGATAVLDKPLRVDELKAAIERAIEPSP
jgi:CheY-like chemotaxis protein